MSTSQAALEHRTSEREPSGMGRRAQALALCGTLAVASFFVALQPLGAPWWLYADSDAAYVSSGLGIAVGAGTKFFDHPGVPLQELVALVFTVRHWVTGPSATGTYVDGLLLHLDATRPYVRPVGAALFLGGVAVAFRLGSWLLGHWAWGVAAGLAVLGAPGLVPMSIQYRADTALPLLLLGTTLLVARGARGRSAPAFLAAGLLAGFSLTMKLSSLPVFVALAVSSAWRRPDGSGLAEVRQMTVRRRRSLIPLAVGAVAAAVIVNTARYPFDLPRSGEFALVASVAGVTAWWVLARVLGRGPFRPFYAALATAVLAGVLLPVAFDLPDGLQMLTWIARGLTGSGVNDGVEPFSTVHASILWQFPLLWGLPMIALALVALVDGAVRRDAVQLPLALAAAAATLMAASRIVGREWYFIPAYVLSIAPALVWLRRRRWPAAAVGVLVALAVIPQALHVHDAARLAAAEQQIAAAADRLELRRGTVALTPAQYAIPDTRFFELVQSYAVHTPPRPYRFLPATDAAAAFASEHGLRPVLAIDLRGSSIVFGNTVLYARPVRGDASFPVARLSP